MMKLTANTQHQNGIVLFVSLIMVLVMTILGVTVISTASLEEKMAGNSRDHQLAFQAAEASLREGERLVQATPNLTTLVNDTCTNGFCTTSRNDAMFNQAAGCNTSTWVDERWVEGSCSNNLQVWSTAGRHRQYITAIPEVRSNPKYIIEFTGYAKKDPAGPATTTTPPTDSGWTAEWSEMYRITAVGTGGLDTTRIMLQSIYKKDLS